MKTTVKFKGIEYPFYKTNRGSFDMSNAGFTPTMMAEGRLDAMLAFIYFQLKDCAKRAGLKFDYTFDQFIDDSDDEIIEVFKRLNEAEPEASGEVAEVVAK